MRPGKIYGLIIFLLILAASLFVLPIQAGGPLLVSEEGNPITWNRALPVPFTPDQSGLGTLTNSQAVALVRELFQVWEDVPTSSVSFEQVGHLSVDANTDSLLPFLNDLDPRISLIVTS